MTKFRSRKTGQHYPLSHRKAHVGTLQKGTAHLTVRQSMFFESRSQLSKIVKMDTPANAHQSVEKLEHMYSQPSTTKAKRTKIIRAMVLAANRAGAQLKRKDLSDKERKEFEAIREIYRHGYINTHLYNVLDGHRMVVAYAQTKEEAYQKGRKMFDADAGFYVRKAKMS